MVYNCLHSGINTIYRRLIMANIQIKDLNVDVELDRKAMKEVFGGQGPGHIRTQGIGLPAKFGMRRSATNAFCGKRSIYRSS